VVNEAVVVLRWVSHPVVCSDEEPIASPITLNPRSPSVGRLGSLRMVMMIQQHLEEPPRVAHAVVTVDQRAD
jgi:hypothetical protein